MLSLFVLVPLAGIMLLNLPLGKEWRKLVFPFAILVAAMQVAVAAIFPALTNDFNLLALQLGADTLARVVLVAIGMVALAALLTGYATIGDELRRVHFANVLLIALVGMNGVTLLQDIFTLYVFIEMTSVASFILIALDRKKEGFEGAFKYIVLSAVATMMMLTGIAVIFFSVGATSYVEVHEALKTTTGNPAVLLGVGIFLCGLFIKGGLVPFHGWVPDAYSNAPASASVLLAGITTKATGIYALMRLAGGVVPMTFGIGQALMALGLISIVIGALGALTQNNMKRLLAYSSISQVGYIILSLGCGSVLGLLGAVMHFFNHATFKSLLFVNAAAVEERTGTTDMAKLGGLGYQMPVTRTTNMIAALSTAGIPPLSGFWSKLIIIIALWKSQHPIYAIAAVMLSLLTLAYMLIMQRKVFFGLKRDDLSHVREASPALITASILLAIPTVFGVFLLPWALKAFNAG